MILTVALTHKKWGKLKWKYYVDIASTILETFSSFVQFTN